ncbi:hypothetical protein ADM96_36500 [Burkholderia sp. ST111]|nr:hypothetical protein ADM96_36500 [Burkholderia sp. ST111]
MRGLTDFTGWRGAAASWSQGAARSHGVGKISQNSQFAASWPSACYTQLAWHAPLERCVRAAGVHID